ncbi:hypothetical protein [Streptomyces sp. NPDC057302]|uniref:hypothetical protein n=1 Tax=Streptomyces sp. NPDC057302 TaxID=3346094 RepID=UPI0036442ACB
MLVVAQHDVQAHAQQGELLVQSLQSPDWISLRVPRQIIPNSPRCTNELQPLDVGVTTASCKNRASPMDIADQAHLISQLHYVVHRPHHILLLSLS